MNTYTTVAQMQHLFAAPTNCKLRACIIVPARNEEVLIADALTALYSQYTPDGMLVDRETYEVLLLVNNSHDQTYALARQFQEIHPDFQLQVEDIDLTGKEAHIGTIRGFLMDKACERISQNGRGDGIIISTDGDTRVDIHWLHHTLEEFDKGCDVVGGRILSENGEPHSYKYHLRNVCYRYLTCQLESLIDPCNHDPWPRHFQCFGPSTAVRCEIYKKAGGIPPLPFLEDENFRKGLLRIDAKLRHSPKVKVYTSGRLEGKVDFGFSGQLQQWKEMYEAGRNVLVDNVQALKIKYDARHQLRQLFLKKDEELCVEEINKLAKQLVANPFLLSKALCESHFFGLCWEIIEQGIDRQGWENKYPLVSIEEGIAQLRQEINRMAKVSAA
ncbi:glycosyltransferase [Olivibacter sitiensis]|uniref:glycosyltransferase n=1 Tax=Olivibacter sitiensis TaxID=376470 RepID=UPI00041D9370|nr:glycosyltransferase [Olivibacter sitiensis]